MGDALQLPNCRFTHYCNVQSFRSEFQIQEKRSKVFVSFLRQDLFSCFGKPKWNADLLYLKVCLKVQSVHEYLTSFEFMVKWKLCERSFITV